MDTLLSTSAASCVRTDKRYKPHLHRGLLDHSANRLREYPHLLLSPTNRNDHSSIHCQLVHECLRHMIWRSSHQDRVEWCVLFPTCVSIPCTNLHVRIAVLAKPIPGPVSELGNDFDGINLTCQLRQNCCLVARAGADLKHLVFGRDFCCLRHVGNDVWLGDCLTEADRKGTIGIRQMPTRWHDELMARHFHHRCEHPSLANP